MSRKPASLFKSAIFGETLPINCDMSGSRLRRLSTVITSYLKVSTTLSLLLFRSYVSTRHGSLLCYDHCFCFLRVQYQVVVPQPRRDILEVRIYFETAGFEGRTNDEFQCRQRKETRSSLVLLALHR